VPVGFTISDTLDGPVGVPWCGRDHALDDNSGESLKFRMAGSDRLRQGLLQGGARKRFAGRLLFAFLPQNQFAFDASLSRLAHRQQLQPIRRRFRIYRRRGAFEGSSVENKALAAFQTINKYNHNPTTRGP
jgi:hypothetical protein